MKKTSCLLLFLFLLVSWYKISFAIKSISKIPVLKGEAVGIFIEGNYAYIAHSEDGLCVINVADPEAPYIEGVYDTDGEALDVFVKGNYAFLADKVGLKILDVSDPNKISLQAEYKTNITNASAVYVKGDYVYLLDRNLGLFIIDISNLKNLELKGNLYFRDGYDIYIKNNYAYIAAWDKVKIINIIDPGTPTLVSSCETPGNAVSIFEKDNIIYVADHNNGIVLIDATNKTNLVATGSYTNIRGLSRDVYVVDNYAYISASTGIYKINVANPRNPSLIDSTPTECAYKLDIKNDFIYIADGKGGMKIYDFDLVKKGVYPTSYDLLHEVYIKGDYAYLAEGYTGLTVVDVTNPTLPKLLTKREICWKASVFLPGTTATKYTILQGKVVDIFVKGRYTYLAAEEAGLVIVNLDNPRDPFIVGACPFGYREEGGKWYRDDIKAYAVYVEGDYAYLASHVWVYEWKNFDWSFTGEVYPSMVIINIKNPLNPYVKNIGGDLGQSPPQDLFFKDNHVFVSTHYNDGDKGLHVVDVSNPDMVIIHKNILKNVSPKPDYVDGIYIKGNYAYLACHEDGLYIIDITNPIKPVFVGKCDTRGRAYKVVVRGDYAYVADREGGVVIIDVRDLKKPQKVDSYCIEDVMGLSLKEGYVESYIYTVDKTGFFILDSEIYYITGKVRDEKGGAIEEVLITIEGKDITGTDIKETRTTTYDGSYEVLDLLRGLYKVVAKKGGFKFNPPERKYYPLDTNKENQDFTGIPIYFIKGKIIRDVTGEGVGGVVLTLQGDGVTKTYTTTSDGKYIFEDLLYGSYTLVPYKENCRFAPSSYFYQPLNEDKYWEDFIAVELYDIVGTITDINNQGLGGVSLSLYKDNSLFRTTITAFDGSYKFIEIPYGTYTLIPTKTNYGFNPASRSFLLNEEKRFNFDAAVIFKISGTVSATATLSPIKGVELQLSGLSFAGTISTSTYTDSGGRYEFQVFEGGTYNIVAKKVMWFFVPPSYTYTNIDQDKHNTNFIGIGLFLIQGTVTYNGSGLEKVEVYLSSGGNLIATDTTSDNGKYKFLNLDSGRDYKVIPKKNNWDFIPPSFSTSFLQNNVEVNFSAFPTTTFSISGFIKDAKGSPLADIKINLLDKSGIKVFTYTTSSGSYTFSDLLPEFYYRIEPQDVAYNFFPLGKYEFENIDGDKIANFIAYKYLKIKGNIKDYFEKTSIKGVCINLTGINALNESIQNNVTSNEKGTYTFSNLIKGTYTITPTITGYIFNPISTQTVLIDEDKVEIDFVGAYLYSISGVVEAWGRGIGGVLMELSGRSPFPGMNVVLATTTTLIDSGRYNFQAVEGNYKLRPYKQNYIFSPPEIEYRPLDRDTIQNFTATPVFSIWGTVFGEGGRGMEGVKITLYKLYNGTPTYATYTTGNGSYSFTAATPGIYTLSAELEKYLFKSEPSMPVRLVNEDIIVNFYATETYSITGYVKDFGGNALEKVEIEIKLIKDNDFTTYTTTTDRKGYYYFIGLERGSYTLTPQKGGYRFEPLKRYILLDEDKSGQNFTGWFDYKVIPQGEVKINYFGEGADKGYFNPQEGGKVVIYYNAPTGGKVKAQIYTLLGQLIKKIEKDAKGGVDNIPWDGKNEAGEIVASGIYIIKIEAEGFKLIKKICIMK